MQALPFPTETTSGPGDAVVLVPGGSAGVGLVGAVRRAAEQGGVLTVERARLCDARRAARNVVGGLHGTTIGGTHA